MDVLKREQKNDKVFICNNIPKIISDIWCISRREVFNIKKSSFQL